MVYTLAWARGELHAAGSLRSAGGVVVNGVARWDGQRWDALDSNGASIVPGEVLALLGSPNELIAGGYFNQAGGVAANGVARWDGQAWSSLGSGAANGVKVANGNSGDVWAMARLGSDLYVGGNFTRAGGLPARNIARWDGQQWHALGAGVDSAVLALEVAGDKLYVGGSFQTAGGIAASRVAVWDGKQWSSLGNGADIGVSDHVHALALAGSELYVGGNFSFLASGLPAGNVAHWDGARWSSMGSGTADGVDGRVEALLLRGDQLFVAGWFKRAGGAPSQGITRWQHVADALFVDGFEPD